MAALERLSRILLRSALTPSRRQLSVAAASAHGDRSARTWKILTLLVALPGVGVCMLNTYLKRHGHEAPEFVPYSHLRVRSKRFPWRDGNKTLFHNAHVNPLPDGYEGHEV